MKPLPEPHPSHRAPVSRRRLVLGMLWSVPTAWLAGCATPAPTLPAAQLLHDTLFAPVLPPFSASDLFAMSPPMLLYARTRLAGLSELRDPRQALLDALYSDQDLRLRYDGLSTRTAAEAFAARAGNCLSLVLMTAAFAKHLGLPVSYRSVLVDDLYTREGGLTLASGHINLVLAPLPQRLWRDNSDNASLTVDFLPANELRGQSSQALQERTLVAMYLNNRAAEVLTLGQLDAAYGWAREALLHDPDFVAAANTLGVIYQRGGHLAAAEAAFGHVLAHSPQNTPALSNLAGLLSRAGRSAEAQAVSARLAQLQPVPPFHHFERGRQAMAAGDFAGARDHFLRELRNQPYQDEVHFWAAQAYWKLGDAERASYHLGMARDNSPTQGKQARYTAKLDHLRNNVRGSAAQRLQPHLQPQPQPNSMH